MRELLDEIAAGDPPEGERLPREVDLVGRWNVSRNVVRETLRALEERGVLSVRHGVGATVAVRDEWQLLDPEVARALLDSRHRKRTLRELDEARRLVEVEAARLAAARASDALLGEIKGAFDAITALPRTAASQRGRAELELHRAIIQAADNRAIAALARPVLAAYESAADRLGRRAQSEDEHAAIVTALLGRDEAAAAEMMDRHLSRLL